MAEPAMSRRAVRCLAQHRRLLVILLVWLVATGACAPAGTAGSPTAGGASSAADVAAPRVLTMAVRHEPTDFSPKIPQAAAGGSIKPLFNAGLGVLDELEGTHPQLAEFLPQLNTDSWRVLPDGRMETRYTLKPNLTWHDGTALTAEDFVFAWEVYRHPSLGIFSPKPQDVIAEVLAPDARTVRILWQTVYPEAGTLTQEHLTPLPRHVLSVPFADLTQDPSTRAQFLNHPYWTTGHIGAGPFQLERWEPATIIEGSAFAGYALGRPQLDRIVVRLMSDENTVLTAMLAGQLQLCYQYCLRFEHALVLQREWQPQGAGVVLLSPEAATYAAVQFRPEMQKTPGLLDVSVRRALAYGIDKQALLDGLFEGQGAVPVTHVPTSKPYYPEVMRRITPYSFDPRQAEQAMVQAGFARDQEGTFVDRTGQRFQPEFLALAGATSERAQAIMTDTWQRMGFGVRPAVLPNAQVRDAQVRHSFPGIGWAVGGSEQTFTSEQIGTANNRWGGSNRGGWSNAEYDRLWDAYNTTLDDAERTGQLVRMAELVNEELLIYILYFNYTVVAHTARLVGPKAKTLWNVHKWALRPGAV